MDHLGRKFLFSFTMLLGGIFTMFCAFVEEGWLRTGLALVGRVEEKFDMQLILMVNILINMQENLVHLQLVQPSSSIQLSSILLKSGALPLGFVHYLEKLVVLLLHR